MHPYQITTSSKYPTSAYYSTELTNSVNSGAFDFNLYTTAATYGATYFVTASSGPVPVGEWSFIIAATIFYLKFSTARGNSQPVETLDIKIEYVYVCYLKNSIVLLIFKLNKPINHKF